MSRDNGASVPGLDPSRDDAFWGPEIAVDGVRPEWLGEQEPFVWLKTRKWLEHFRKPVMYGEPFATSTRFWAWRHSDGRPCIRAIRLPADHPAYGRKDPS
jgi:hypothetical protein